MRSENNADFTRRLLRATMIPGVPSTTDYSLWKPNEMNEGEGFVGMHHLRNKMPICAWSLHANQRGMNDADLHIAYMQY